MRMNFPFTKKQSSRINSKNIAAGVGTAAGVGLLAFGVKKFLEARSKRLQSEPEVDSSAFEARASEAESPRGFAGDAQPNSRVDRASYNSFPASDAPSHMPGTN